MPKENDNPITTTKKGLSSCSAPHALSKSTIEREVTIPEITGSVIATSSSSSTLMSMGHSADMNEPTTTNWGWYLMRSCIRRTNQKSSESLKGRKAQMGQTPHGSMGRTAPKNRNPKKQSVLDEYPSQTLHRWGTSVAESSDGYHPK